MKHKATSQNILSFVFPLDESRSTLKDVVKKNGKCGTFGPILPFFWAVSPLLKTAKKGSGNWVGVFLDESVPNDDGDDDDDDDDDLILSAVLRRGDGD